MPPKAPQGLPEMARALHAVPGLGGQMTLAPGGRQPQAADCAIEVLEGPRPPCAFRAAADMVPAAVVAVWVPPLHRPGASSLLVLSVPS
eukprot:10994673-Alexandrium_andersonii.AAC.1